MRRTALLVCVSAAVAAAWVAVPPFADLTASAAPPSGPTITHVTAAAPMREFHGSVRSLPHRSDLLNTHERPRLEGLDVPDPTDGDLTKVALPGAVEPDVPPDAPAAPAPGPGGGGDLFAAAFAGLDKATWGAGWPPDTNGDVGYEHYIQTVNTSIGIFRKGTGAQIAAFTLNTFWSGAGTGTACDSQHRGDPVVVFDPMADRWIFMDFAFASTTSGPYFLCIAVSKSGDPVGGGWYLYPVRTDVPGTISSGLPDYPKMGIWPDGLYVTANVFCFPGQQASCATTGTFKEVKVWAFDRDALESGAPLRGVTVDLNTNAQFSLLPSNMRSITGAPPGGRENILVAESRTAFAFNVFKLHVDYAGGGSTFTGPTAVSQASYTLGPSSVPSPANNLDALRDRLMMQAQYTNVGGAESVWVEHTVSCCGASSPAGIQWAQLSVTGGTVATTPVQQQIYPPSNDGLHRWMGSLAVDKLGDMALGYSVSNATTNPDIRYAGRFATDPLGTLPQTETSLLPGVTRGSQSGTCGSSTCIRWGDYSAMTLDPNGCDLWYTQEYYAATGLNWQTRITSMRLNPACVPTKYPTTTTVDAATGPYGGTLSLSATVRRGPNGLTNKTVTFKLNGTSVGSAATAGNGIATLAGVSLAGIDAGTYPSGITATFAGDAVYLGSSSTGGLTVTALDQSISVTTHAPASAAYNTTFTVAATASSGLAVSFSSAGACSNTGATFTMTSGTGTCTVRYDQAGNVNYHAAPQVADGVTAAKIDQTISLSVSAPPAAVYGTSFTVAATASSGLAVSFSSGGACSNAGPTFTMTSGTGTCAVAYSQGGDTNYNAATVIVEPVAAAKAGQTIAVTTHAPPSAVYNASFSVAATASSGLAVTLSSGGVCSNVGAAFTMTSGTGSCTVGYDQAGDANYSAAPGGTELVAAAKAGQTITVTTHAPASSAYSTAFSVAATASSGLPVAFSSSGVCSNGGATFTMTSGTGTCTVAYDQAGNANYQAAGQLSDTVAAAKADQSITVTAPAPATAVYGASFTVAANASSGLAVSFSSGGVCANVGPIFTMSSGTGSCTVAYDQAGDANYNTAPTLTEPVAAAKAGQTITVTTHAPASAVYATTFSVAATASSGLAVSFSSAGVCTNVGPIFTMKSGTGTCTVAYDQAGDANYSAAPQVSDPVAATKAAQTVTVTTHAPATAVYGTSFTVAATASSGLAVSFSSGGVCSNVGPSFTMTSGTGTCTVAYDQAGDANYGATPTLTEPVTAARAGQTITVTTHAPASAVYNTGFSVAATASSGLAVSFSSGGVCSNVGATVTMTSGTGTCTVVYDQAGSANYSAAPGLTEPVAAAKAGQTITFGALANKTYGDADFVVTPSASSGLAVSLSATGACGVSGPQVHLTGAGSCALAASQSGDANYDPADPVTRSFAIASATLTVGPDPANATRPYSDPDPAFTWRVIGGLVPPDTSAVVTLVPVCSTTATRASAPGTYPVTCSGGAAASYVLAYTPGTLTVSQRAARVTYTGADLFWTPAATSTTATATLSATVRDISAVPGDPAYDPYGGDIRNAHVTFIDRDTNTPLAACAGLPVGLADPADTTTGIATCTATLTASNATGATQYTLGIVVSGYYTRDSSSDNEVIDVAQPITSSFITGGGHITLASSAGRIVGDPGSKTNFGFNVKYNKTGTSLHGSFNLIVRSGGRVYQIKGTSYSSLAVAGATANFASKANVQDITDPLSPVSLGGNMTLQVWMTDGDAPGTDTIAIQLLDSGGALWFSSSWNGVRTIEQAVSGGSLVVH